MKKILLLLAVFSFGYMFNDLTEKMNIDLIQPVNAEVADMDYYDLKTDYDFKKAVRRVVENYCSISGESISC
jgi:hypothetical protein